MTIKEKLKRFGLKKKIPRKRKKTFIKHAFSIRILGLAYFFVNRRKEDINNLWTYHKHLEIFIYVFASIFFIFKVR